MKLINLSEHPLALSFLSRGRQWVAGQRATNAKKTEVLPPATFGVRAGKCAGPTLAIYKKTKFDATDSVMIMDVGPAGACAETAGFEHDVNVEVDGVTYRVNMFKGTGTTNITCRVYAGGVLVKTRNFSVAVTPFDGSNFFKVVSACDRGVAFAHGNAYLTGDIDGWYIFVRGYWLDTEYIARAVAAPGTSGVSAPLNNIIKTQVLDESLRSTDSFWGSQHAAAWVADNKLYFAVNHGGVIWPLGISPFNAVVNKSKLFADQDVVYDSDDKVIFRAQYLCAGGGLRLYTGLRTGVPAGGTLYSGYQTWNNVTEYYVSTIQGSAVSEVYFGYERNYSEGQFVGDIGQQYDYSYPVYRGDDNPNLVAHYYLDYSFGVNPRMISAVAATINGTRYTYDIQPAGSNLNEPMTSLFGYDRFFAGVVNVGGVDTYALACTDYPTTTVHHGYIASGATLTKTNVRVLPSNITNNACSLHGKLAVAEDGVLEFRRPALVPRTENMGAW